jgi:hypothetical protein
MAFRGRVGGSGVRRHGRAWLAAVVLAVALPLAACGGTTDVQAGAEPASVERAEGSHISRVRLTAEAAKLLGVRTARVRSDGAGGRRTIIPSDAVLYDPDGAEWTYTSPAPLVYQRADIRVARIDGDSAILTKGPPAGTRVVTAGAIEIWGVEYGDIEED